METKQCHKRIMFWDDEHNTSNRIIVTLANGWAFDSRMALHVEGFDTVKQAMEGVRNAHPCTCGRCTGKED